MDTGTLEYIKTFGSLAGFVALIWNLISTYYNRRGRLEVTLGWSTNPDNYDTYFEINVVNHGIDTRVIESVSAVYLDERPKKDIRNSTSQYIKNLPGVTLKRGEKATEKILYQQNKHLADMLLNRPIRFCIIDTFGKKYYSNDLNGRGMFKLPKNINNEA